MTTNAEFVPLDDFASYSESEMEARAAAFFDLMKKRRTVRDFKETPAPRSVIENALRTAGRAPSGANKQPWHFAVIEDDQVKSRLRAAAEEEERAFYGGRASEQWLADLAHLGTNEDKPFLEIAPHLIVVFRENYGLEEESGKRTNNYYVHESVGIACGLLIAALHNAGLATLTHTPSPMNFLNEICRRPKNERAVMVIVAGYPVDGCMVPKIEKKPLEDFASWI